MSSAVLSSSIEILLFQQNLEKSAVGIKIENLSLGLILQADCDGGANFTYRR